MEPARKNLVRLFHLRNVAIAGQAAAAITAHFALGVRLPLAHIGALIALSALINLLTRARLSRLHPVGDAELFLQLVLDVLALSGLFYFSGGWTNPFVSLYLLPLTIAASVLPVRYTWAIVALTLFTYTVLVFHHVPLPDAHLAHDAEISLHALGMWFSFGLSATLIAFFVAKMASTLREHDRLLARTRENRLRDERILALGTQAAGAAHELGTPLSTIAVLVQDLNREYGDDPAFKSTLSTLRSQVAACKNIITELLASAGQSRGEGGRASTVDEFLKTTVAKWRTLRPAMDVTCRFSGTAPGPRIVAEQTLAQSIISLLNNAADACPGDIVLSATWNDRDLTIDICDRGAGFAPAAVSRAGKMIFSTKAPTRGSGLGLFLANAAIERLGGIVTLSNRAEGGASTRIFLPISPLMT